MGYIVECEGTFAVTPRLDPDQVRYLAAFAASQRIGLRIDKIRGMADPRREAVGLPLGPHGAYYVGHVPVGAVRSPHRPPDNQPSMACGWTVNASGTAVLWGGRNRCDSYEVWLAYLVDRFLDPWGRTIRGTVRYLEDTGHAGILAISGTAGVKIPCGGREAAELAFRAVRDPEEFTRERDAAVDVAWRVSQVLAGPTPPPRSARREPPPSPLVVPPLPAKAPVTHARRAFGVKHGPSDRSVIVDMTPEDAWTGSR